MFLVHIVFFTPASLHYSMLDVVYPENIQLYGIKKNFTGKKTLKSNKRGGGMRGERVLAYVVCTQTNTHTRTNKYTHTHKQIHTHAQTNTHTRTNKYTHTHKQIHTHAQTNTHTRTNKYTHI